MTLESPAPSNSTLPPRPPFWRRLSISTGNLLQLGGITLGILLLYWSANLTGGTVFQVLFMLLGWLCLYICTHASAHWAVGRLVGIRFKGYGLRGSDHVQDYPPIPGLRGFMSHFPTFTALTEKHSMIAAQPIARALMFAAGETSTTLFCILVGLYVWKNEVPLGGVFFVIMVLFSLMVTVLTAITPRGDYAKALYTLRHPMPS